MWKTLKIAMFGIPTAAGCYYAYQYKKQYDEMKEKIQKRKEATQERITAIKETATQRKQSFISSFKGWMEDKKEKFSNQQNQANQIESTEETGIVNEGIQEKQPKGHIIESLNLLNIQLPEETQEKASIIMKRKLAEYAEKKETFKQAIQKRQDQRQQDQPSPKQVSQLDNFGQQQEEQQEVKLSKE